MTKIKLAIDHIYFQLRRSPLSIAALNGHYDFTKSLISHGAKIDILNKVGYFIIISL